MQSSKLPIAFFIACALHGLIGLILLLTPPLIPEREDKSIPILLVSSQQATVAQQTPTTRSEQHKTREQITTQGHSEFSKNINDQPSPAAQHKAASNSEAPEMPSFSQLARTQTNRSQQSNTGLKQLFSQEQASARNAIKQISNSELPPLSDYEIELLQKLAANELYNDYPKVLANNKRERIDFTIEIALFPNGAIKAARINRSSEISIVDELAIQTAYNASPYGPPPKEDIEKGFRYLIPISYQSKK